MARIPSLRQAWFKRQTSDTFYPSTIPWRMQGMAAWQNATAKQLIYLFFSWACEQPKKLFGQYWVRRTGETIRPGHLSNLAPNCCYCCNASTTFSWVGRTNPEIPSQARQMLDHLQEALNYFVLK